MKEIYKKIQMCRQSIKDTGTKKKGRNDYSKYDYFTPDQIHDLAFNACKDHGLFCKFDLDKDQFGFFGKLVITDLESGEIMEFIMRTDIPSITATNITQQIGGAVTYTHRYLLMTAFDIQDNNLDFDTTQNTKKTAEGSKNNEPEKPLLNKWNKDKTEVNEYYQKVVKEARDQGLKLNDLHAHYEISKEVVKELELDLN